MKTIAKKIAFNFFLTLILLLLPVYRYIQIDSTAYVWILSMVGFIIL